MLPRVAVLFALLCSSGLAQYSGLSATADGSSVYFVTTLRLRNTQEPRNGKVFVAADTVTLFRAHGPEGVAPGTPPCGVSGFQDYTSAETSASGAVALQYAANSYGGCSFPINTNMSQVLTGAAEMELHGITRLSPNGRYAFNFLAATLRPWDPFTLASIDLQTQVKTPVKGPAISFPDSVRLPSGRGVADDGTAILGVFVGGTTGGRGYLLRPGADPQLFSEGIPLAIDAAAAHVLYQGTAGVALFDLRTGQSTLLVTDRQAFNFQLSNDARRLAYIQSGQVHVLDTVTSADRTLSNDAAGITALGLSGDGKVVYAETSIGRLLKIAVDSGVTVELIGHTPYISTTFAAQPGLVTTLNGGGLATAAIDNQPPYPAWAGTLTMWIGERKVPVIGVKPDSVTFLVPWDIQAVDGTVRVQAEVSGEHTPFYYPEVELPIYADSTPRAGAVTRANWEQFYVGPVSPGEIIHVFALGFGPVSPEVPEGAAAPAVEPYARLAQPLTCGNLDVLYAGLTPYTVQRIYQLDLRIGPKVGYQQFSCTVGNSAPFIFLTLNVAP
ncbi:MAG: hypothetical protein ABI759_20050 [Candidatus Solibacter sp.]